MDGPGHVRCASACLLLLSFLCPITAQTCLNGGTFDGGKCICPPAYFGPRCEECVDASLCSTAAPTASPAPPTTTTMPTTTTATTAQTCLNGGTFDGVKCLCPPAYFGPRCEECVDAGLCGTATPTAPPTTTTTAITTTGICQNGGTWLGEACHCTHYFWGPRCEFVVNVIEVNTAVSAWIDVAVTVTNRRFVAALADPSTKEYRDFAREFTQQVGAIYRKVPEYHNTTVGQLRPGSVVVQHVVGVRLPLSARVGAALREAAARLVGALRDAAREECGAGAALCLDASSIRSSEGSIAVDAEEICGQAVPAGFGPHFSGRPTDAGYECITRCAQGRWDSPLCRHGQCQVPISGPQCYCPSTDASWFLGDDCSVHISKVGLSIGLPLSITTALAVALAMVQLRK